MSKNNSKIVIDEDIFSKMPDDKVIIIGTPPMPMVYTLKQGMNMICSNVDNMPSPDELLGNE